MFFVLGSSVILESQASISRIRHHCRRSSVTLKVVDLIAYICDSTTTSVCCLTVSSVNFKIRVSLSAIKRRPHTILLICLPLLEHYDIHVFCARLKRHSRVSCVIFNTRASLSTLKRHCRLSTIRLTGRSLQTSVYSHRKKYTSFTCFDPLYATLFTKASFTQSPS